ncbi:hypothetical protein [uncultured Paraglaciecola sp.]|uniref:hypothetical protein n=1 Tax=uncultured Paraglaciecola sp. TaxID=1765024 RepID=UPI00260B2010|nr:hypothetical protein [uncultured Paraglaciecola sp.]
MNKQTIVEQLTILSEIYRQPVSQDLPKIWFNDFADYPDDFLIEACTRHRLDPDQGRFWPTPAHLFSQMMFSSAKIKTLAAQAFEDNPGIDGTDSHTLQHESFFDRNQRKRQHIAQDLEDWQDWSIPRKLEFSKAITSEQAQMIASPTQGIEHVS